MRSTVGVTIDRVKPICPTDTKPNTHSTWAVLRIIQVLRGQNPNTNDLSVWNMLQGT